MQISLIIIYPSQNRIGHAIYNNTAVGNKTLAPRRRTVWRTVWSTWGMKETLYYLTDSFSLKPFLGSPWSKIENSGGTYSWEASWCTPPKCTMAHGHRALTWTVVMSGWSWHWFDVCHSCSVLFSLDAMLCSFKWTISDMECRCIFPLLSCPTHCPRRCVFLFLCDPHLMNRLRDLEDAPYLGSFISIQLKKMMKLCKIHSTGTALTWGRAQLVFLGNSQIILVSVNISCGWVAVLLPGSACFWRVW
jgi:hypothetical protein